jgi:hypothetical protein
VSGQRVLFSRVRVLIPIPGPAFPTRPTEFPKLCSTLNVPEAMGNAEQNIRMVTSGAVVRTIRWAGGAARVGEVRCAVLLS